MKNKCALCAVTSLVAVLTAGFILLIVATMPSRNYNVAIDSVSGLDLPIAAQVDPQFNLTLRFTSTNPLRRECMDADTYIQVSYRCTQLAVAALSPDRLCVGPKKSTEARFVAKGTGVRLPGSLMDSLEADMRNGVEAFDVRLLRSGDDFSVVLCGDRRVGAGGAWCGYLWDKCAPPKDTTASDAVIFYTPISIPPGA